MRMPKVARVAFDGGIRCPRSMAQTGMLLPLRGFSQARLLKDVPTVVPHRDQLHPISHSNSETQLKL